MLLLSWLCTTRTREDCLHTPCRVKAQGTTTTRRIGWLPTLRGWAIPESFFGVTTNLR